MSNGPMPVDSRPLVSQATFNALARHPQYADDPHIREKLMTMFRIYKPMGLSDDPIAALAVVLGERGKR